ncbi:MAG TPA: CvpA family protein, partial [Acidimicrobiales bacterium]|nr:CvpA family protein [Acidimicrobiales bacterium]
MSLFDLAIVVLVLILAVGGYNLGFVARVTSWIGVAIGIAVAAFVAPRILDSFRLPDPTSNLVLVAGIFIVIASMGGAVGTAIGTQLRRS